MFNSATLDILIGLMTIYLTVSLAVTALSEVVSQCGAMRARNLKRALVGMLDGSKSNGIGIRDHWFLNQPLIAALTGGANEMPSYLDKKTFSAALLMAIEADYAKMDLPQLEAAITRHVALSPGAKAILLAFLKESGGELEKFKTAIETWFDSVMDRASGWYKRNIATATLILSAVVVVGANIDTIVIGKALYGDPTLREAMLKLAIQDLEDGLPSAQAASTTPPPASNAQPAAPVEKQMTAEQRLAQYHTNLEHLRSSGLPIGWQSMTWPKDHAYAWWFSKLAGWMITVFAASLGAPFWFDMLSRIVNIRSTGPKPEEPKKPPQAITT